MEIKKQVLNLSMNLNAPNTPQILNQILKCPECFNIPEISKNYWGEYIYKCRNNHNESLELNELIEKCCVPEIYKCSFGNETNLQDKYLLFNFCFKCKKIICSERNCQKTHEEQCDEKNNFIPCKNLVSLCYEHGEKLSFYCPKCDINICEKCEGHEEYNIKFMNKMKIEEKEIKLYDFKIQATNNYLNYIEKKVNDFKKEWKEYFESSFKYFEENIKYFFEKNRNQAKLIQNILNTYKIKGNISIENYKNIKIFCKIPELKFNLPYGINEKKDYIENFANTFLIDDEHIGKKKDKGKKCKKSKEPEQIKIANDETISLSLNKLNELFEISKIEKEENIRKAIEYILNDYLSKNSVFSNDYHWYEKIIEDNCWEIINYLVNI